MLQPGQRVRQFPKLEKLPSIEDFYTPIAFFALTLQNAGDILDQLVHQTEGDRASKGRVKNVYQP